MQVIDCPTPEQLTAFLAGLTSDGQQQDEYEQHLLNCPHCSKLLETITNEDTLTTDLRRPVKPMQSSPILERLKEKLRSHPPVEAAPIPVNLESTQAETPELRSAMLSQSRNEDTEWLSQIVSPAKSSGELGQIGPYRILKLLGRGGMGAVLLAEDPALERQVALKVLLPEIAMKKDAKERFLREARIAAKIDHENIVSIYQVGEDRGVPYIAMQLLKGLPLDEWIKQRKKENPTNPITAPKILKIAREIAQGLAAAHARGLIHRDIKPANIWLDASAKGRVKILDFGLARGSDASNNGQLTQSGAVMGTPAYMSPEQARGNTVDARSDLFSLGGVIYLMCTGHLPFKGTDTLSILTSLAIDTPSRPIETNHTIPPALNDLAMKLLEKDPAKRFSTAEEVVRTIQQIERSATVDKTREVVAQAVAVAVPPVANDPWADIDADTDVVKPVVAPVAPPPKVKASPQAKQTSPATMKWVAVVLGLLLVVGFVSSQFIFTTKDGTLVVEVDDDADVRFKKGKLEVYDDSGKLKYTIEPSEKNKTLPPGRYLVKVIGADGVKLETDRFELERNGKAWVRIHATTPTQVVAKETKKEPEKEYPIPMNLWKPTPEQQAYLDAVAVLPPKQRVESVIRKLNEINPRYGEFPGAQYQFEPAEGNPTRLKMVDVLNREIWPLAALPSIKSLDLSETCAIRLEPLSRLPLRELQVRIILDNVGSEEALKGMPSLTKINDISVKEFWTTREEVRKEVDRFAQASASLSLEDQTTWVRTTMARLHPKLDAGTFNAVSVCKLEGTEWIGFRGYDLSREVYDFSPVRALNIEGFFLLDGNLFDATPFGKMKPKLAHIRWIRNCLVQDITPLKDHPIIEAQLNAPIRDFRPLSGKKIKHLSFSGDVKELSALKGMPLESLSFAGISDLSPLKGMPLKRLTMGNYCPVSDLSPLQGMPLESLIFDRSKVTDLSPLKGMPLKELVFFGSPILDLSPLEGMQLTTLEPDGEGRPFS